MKHTKKYICSSSSNDQQFEYMLLDRLRTDCNYFLKHPHEKHLWAGSIDGQIEKMKELYDTLKIKPEWLSMEDINRYEKEMKAASGKGVTAAEDLNRYEFLVKTYDREEDRETVTAISLEDAEDQLNSDGYVEYWDYLPDFNYDIEESLVESAESINDKKLKVFTFSSTENVPFAHYVRWFVYADSEDSAREMIDTYLSINKFNFSDFHGGRQITKKEMKRMIDRGVDYIELTPDNFMNKE